MCCPQLCSHCGWLLLKCSAIGIGFNGAETNCRIAHILGILLMNSCNTDKCLATTIICSLSALNYNLLRADRLKERRMERQRSAKERRKALESKMARWKNFDQLEHSQGRD